MFADEYPAMAMAPREGNDRLLAALDRASRDFDLGGAKALNPSRRGADDISFVAPRMDGLDGLGEKGEGARVPEEWAHLGAFTLQIKRASFPIYRLIRP